MTIGVLSRVEELSDRPPGFKPEGAIPFKNLIPLEEIIADVLGVGIGTKQVELEYKKLIDNFGNEFSVLLERSEEELEKVTLPEIVQGIMKMREGKVFVEPGYDGVYGKIRIFDKEDKKKEEQYQKQKTLL